MITYFSTMAQIIPVLFLVVVVEYRQFGQKEPPRSAITRDIKSIYLLILGIVILVSGTAAEWTALTATFVLGVKDEAPEYLLPAANFCFIVVIAMAVAVAVIAGTQVLMAATGTPATAEALTAAPADAGLAPTPVSNALEGGPDEEPAGIGAVAAVTLAAATALIVSMAVRRSR